MYPTAEFIRNKEYIDSAAKLAVVADVPIILYGSVLQHAYYQLKSIGARVLCSDPLNKQTKRTTYEKLVRDNIPEKIRSSGELASIEIIGGGKLEECLREKLIEEAYEVYWSNTRDETVEELADLLEVIDALSTHIGVKRQEIDVVQSEKKKLRGGFEKGIVLVETVKAPLIQVTNKKVVPRIKSQSITKEKESHSSTVIHLAAIPKSNENQSINLKTLGLSLRVKYQPGQIVLEFHAPSSRRKNQDKLKEVVQLELPLTDEYFGSE
jgi:predicted house-cleaning noncanonical NTP pyrophosphatase (MazG superfamily)